MKRWAVVLSALLVTCAGGQIASASVQVIPITGATAPFEQVNFGIGYAWDLSFDDAHGWAVNPHESENQSATFSTNSATFGAGSKLTFTLSQLFKNANNPYHLLREFTLSYLDQNGQASVIDSTFGLARVSSISNLTISSAGVVLNADYHVANTPTVPETDTYVLSATLPSTVQITGFRLDVIAPVGTQYTNNNFVLTEFGVTVDAVPEPSTFAIWSALGGLGLIAARRGRKRVA